MTRDNKVVAKLRSVKASGWAAVEEYNQILDDEALKRYIEKIMKEDGVSYEEAWRLVREDPKYSLGYKMCSPSIIMMLQHPKGPDRFREMLTPEELEIYNTEVDGVINIRKAVKKEKKKQKKARL